MSTLEDSKTLFQSTCATNSEPYALQNIGDMMSPEFTENCIIIIASTDTQRVINLITDTPSVVCWQSCELCIIYGCTDSTASNFNINATIDDGSCITCLYGCMDSLAINYDSLATCQDTSCIYPQTLGCTASLACNFNPEAGEDDGSCNYPDECGICDGLETGPGAIYDCGCEPIPEGECD